MFFPLPLAKEIAVQRGREEERKKIVKRRLELNGGTALKNNDSEHILLFLDVTNLCLAVAPLSSSVS